MFIANSKVLIKPFNRISSSKRFFGSQSFDVVDDELVIKKPRRQIRTAAPNTPQSVSLGVPDGNPNAQTTACGHMLAATDENKDKKEYKLNARKIKRRLYSWFKTDECTKHIYFLTISFPLGSLDDEIFKYYNIFLTKMRKLRLLRSYLWVSERQKNGTLHFHILLNKQINIVQVNGLLRETLVNAYNSNNDIFRGYNPAKYSGVDLAKDHKTRKVVNFANCASKQAISYYITKYITKNTESFTHLCWHCSRDISNLFTYALHDYSLTEFNLLLNSYKHKYIVTETAIIYIFESDFWTPEIAEMHALNNIISDSMIKY